MITASEPAVEVVGSRLPRLLLVSETTLATTRAEVSANPTLFNLFSGYPPDSLFSMAPAGWPRPQSPFDRLYLGFQSVFLPRPLRGRRFFDPVLLPLDCQILDALPPPHRRRVRLFDPDVVLVSPITPPGLVVGRRLAQLLKKPTVVYFMDDWPAAGACRWLTGGVRQHTQAILRDADAWVMISEELRENMAQRYRVACKPTLVAHNPVDLRGREPPTPMPRRSGRFRVVYAGSVQTMHLDGLLAVAEAIHRLRAAGHDIELVLHTTRWFAQYYGEHWTRWGVVMGGLIPYDDLFEVLRDADLLLIALSFKPELAHMAMYSLLTKITDYMATGVPLLVCGPAGSASVNFVHRWGCGLACDTNDVGRLSDFLRNQLGRPPRNAELAARAYQVLQSEFSTRPVQRRLYDFLTRVAGSRAPLGRMDV
jgi:glycosyltransferase involved in cell wall biosynthesis